MTASADPCLRLNAPKEEAPKAEKDKDGKEVAPAPPALPTPLPDLTVALSQLNSAQKIYSAQEKRLPPAPPHTWKGLQKTAAVPHDPHAYFPMDMYK